MRGRKGLIALAAVVAFLASVFTIAVGFRDLFAPSATASGGDKQPTTAVSAPYSASVKTDPSVPATPTEVKASPSEGPSIGATAPGASPSDDTDTGSGPQVTYLVDVPVLHEDRGAQCSGGCVGRRDAPASIAGRTYPQSVVIPQSPRGNRSLTEFNATGHCSKLSATVGLTDDAQRATVHYGISIDGGATRELGSVKAGDSAVVDFNMQGVARFALSSFVTNAEGDQTWQEKFAWGDAQLLCDKSLADQ